MNCTRFWLSTIILLLAVSSGCRLQYDYDAAGLPEVVDFNFHVKPILSDRCFKCHGPDVATREAGLRLDLPEGAIDAELESGGHAIVPGSLRRSKLFHRISSDDPEQRMPPAESNLTLSENEVAILARWIEQGAEYKPHWAFLPIEEPTIPAVQDEEWVRNPIDRFILAQLEAKRLSPESEADKETLLRRVTLDLTGLPPTIEEIDAFLTDDRPEAYESAVDRLMSTDAYAERMALDWLDVARYADSHGYSLDGARYMWPWRDWVIEAFRSNMPYDEFLTWQLAGDLLPNATQDQRLATAFLRNQRLNSEGGIVPEEYLVEYAVDRTTTASTAFMGLTMECARCHDHKYDPISQREFYQMYAFFNNVNELGEIRGDGNDGPQVLISDEETDARIRSLNEKITSIENQMLRRSNDGSVDEKKLPRLDLTDGLISHLTFDTLQDERPVDGVATVRHDPISEEAELVPSRSGMGLKFTPYGGLAYPMDFAQFDRADPFSFSFWIEPHPESDYMSLLMKSAGKNDSMRGYEVSLQDNRLAVHLISTYPANQVAVHTTEELPLGEWSHIAVSYDGTGKAAGIQLFIDGKPTQTKVVFDRLNQSIVSKNKKRPLRIGWRRTYQKDVDEGHAVIDDLRIYNRKITGLEAAMLHGGLKEAGEADAALQREHVLLRQDTEYTRLQKSLLEALEERNAIQDTLAGVMVMDDAPMLRPTHVLNRGVYDAPGEQVNPSTPASILAFSDNLPQNRLGLARWLLDEEHPLTARVAVNRFWQMFFGRGIVETSEDFGNQGALPSHPELLDWLARSFIESGWDTRGILKMIVTSAAYRQSSIAAPQKRALDPENIWLARGPSHRLPAETLRDQALSASGLLVHKIGGPSVKPYQPPGLWAEKSEFTELMEYVPDRDENQYRRGMYTFWRRTSPPPAMILFDAPTRDNCIVRRQHTSTPLQALVLLNDPQFVEAARVLAERVMLAHPEDTPGQITLAYRLLTGKKPDIETLNLLVDLFEEETQAFSKTPDEAEALLSTGDAPPKVDLDTAKHAAMTVVCNTMMSLDESVRK